MITLIYGTNQVAVRNFILKTAQDNKVSSIKEYSLDADNISNIETTLQTDIFGETALNVIDVTRVLKAQAEKLFDILKRYPESNVVLVSGKDLEAGSVLIKSVRDAGGKVVTATVARPNDVFRYLDDLFNKREAQCYENFRKLLEADNDPVYILVMLQYQLKNVALAKFGLGNKLPPFQVTAAQRQSANFTDSKIKELYELLFKYDVALKTGKILPEAVALLATSKILAG